MIAILKSIQEAEQFRLPFLVYAPRSHEPYDISVRVHDERWPTIRYHVKLAGKEIRVKQFFLDWFFPGFPKSMLKDFSSGYSNIRSREIHGHTMFLGRNYRKRDAASAWVHGTTIEMDSASTVSDDEYEHLLEDLLAVPPDKERLKKYQFPDRSHFARGYGSDWYENRRISRLAWRRTGAYPLKINGKDFLADGLGYIQSDDKTQEILIFQEGSYSRALWIEIASMGIGLEHAIYDVRKGEGLFDTELTLAGNDGTLIFRKPSGPGVLRLILETSTITVGFSPGMDLKDVSAFISGFEGTLSLIRDINGSVPHRDANL